MPIDGKEGPFNQSKDQIKEPIENPNNFPTEEAEDRQPINYDELSNKEDLTNKEAIIDDKKKQRLTGGEKMRLILEDESSKQALYALLRTFANLGISVADAFPGIGELPSWAADAVKFFKLSRAKNIERKKEDKKKSSEEDKEQKNFWAKIDLSPDVPIWIASGFEAIDFALGTGIPSHAIETTMQLKHDWPRMKEGLKKIKEIMGAKTLEELKIMADQELNDYQENKDEIDQALETFKS
jgi:hypothetical protein